MTEKITFTEDTHNAEEGFVYTFPKTGYYVVTGPTGKILCKDGKELHFISAGDCTCEACGLLLPTLEKG